MNLYVETNFILEIALDQEEAESCNYLLNLCREHHARLIIPGYCFAEPHETLKRRQKERKKLETDLKRQIKDMSRTATRRDRLSRLDEILEVLTESTQEDSYTLNTTCFHLLQFADIIPLNAEVLNMSDGCRRRHDLSPQDSIVYASILFHLGKYHSSTNFVIIRDKDFASQSVKEELLEYNCMLISRFNQARGIIGRALS